jgi:hypothetical protein
MTNQIYNPNINDAGIDLSIPDTPANPYYQEPEVKRQAPISTDISATTLVKADENFLNKKWRPMMAWVYMAICICDFIIFPVLWSVLQAAQGIMINQQWLPITLEGGGLIHVAMGAVLGISAYGRTQEKLNDKL